MNVKRYEWKEGSRYGVDPNVVGRAIERVREKVGLENQELEPAQLVEAAADESSPLHRLFCWDDGEAGRLYRESQARSILRSIRIVLSGGEDKVLIANVAVKTDSTGSGRAYVPIDVASRNENLRDQMLADAIRGLEGWKVRYKHLAGASAALAHVDKAIAGLRRARVKKRALQPTN